MSITVDANANRRPINPLIYGTNYGNAATLPDLNTPLNRMGGNNTSRYNWQLNADNRGQDWYFQSIAEANATAGERGDTFVSVSKAAGAQPMITIPMLDWVAKLGSNRGKLASFSIAKYGAQTDRDWQWMPDAGNGIWTNGQYVTGNDPNDANVRVDSVFQQGWVNHLVSRWGTAASGGVKYYILDNEHSIWHSTHRDVQPTGARAAEIRNKMLDYAARIKASDPGALIVGPEEWGWSGFIFSGYDQQWGSRNGWSNLPDRTTQMGGMDYLPWLLSQWKNSGAKPVDIFSVHWYPQGGEFSNDVSTTMQLRRNRSTRSLWDPNYVDPTWINATVKLVPRLREWANTYYYAGTPIAITEYNWGAENHINGATTQADIYGIFGREGLDLATRWTTPDPSTPTYKAMKMYRNYDGNKSMFGDTSVATTVPNPDELSAFAAVRSSDGAMTVMVINKALSGSAQVSLNLNNFGAGTTAQAWQLTAANAITRIADVPVSGASLSTTVPGPSVTLFIVPPGSSTGNRAPTASFTATPTTGQAPLVVSFNAAASSDPDGSIASYRWEFGDGATATGVQATRSYATAGTFTARLTVTDNGGATATTTRQITVTAPPQTSGCSVRYVNTNDWGNGFLADVYITNNGSTQIRNWTLTWTFAGNQRVTNLWNGRVTQSGKNVSVRNESWNATLAARATTQIGFVATYTGTNAKPTAFKLNNVSCAVQ
ncbi:MAG: cellulose binding domain-containing protein [Bryobacterales bacterium]|nr:cellulose binding domain-containing protein [Bryobacterales bacterium]